MTTNEAFSTDALMAMAPRFPSGALLESSPLVLTSNALSLRLSVESQHRDRMVARESDIAELFHVNSALSPHTRLNAVVDSEYFARLLTWRNGTGYRPLPGVVDVEAAKRANVVCEQASLGETASGALSVLCGISAERTYALDFTVLSGPRVYHANPGSDLLWQESELGASQLDTLRRGLCDSQLPDGDEWPVLLFVVGCPRRRMMLQGPRGYRRTLIDCGAVVSEIQGALASTLVAVTYDFYDDLVNDVLDIDGVERAVLAVLTLRDDKTSAQQPLSNDGR